LHESGQAARETFQKFIVTFSYFFSCWS